jgi:lipopolysaccharide/colanic/teichoic acid biosynthesis glycosyltransferase/glycosyltransferase involved in cell wall biosynthesis
MWLPTRWLEERLALLGLALFDAILIVCTYNVLFWCQFNDWVGVTGAVATLAALWVTLSYLLGRYSLGNTQKPIWTIGGIVGVVISVTMLAVWLGLATDPRALPDFVVPLLACTAIVSALGEQVVARRTRQPRTWTFLITEDESRIMRRELSISKKAEELNVAICTTTEYRDTTLGAIESAKGIAIGEQVDIKNSQLQQLLIRKRKGQKVLKLLDWCELYLLRVAPELALERSIQVSDGFQLRHHQRWSRLKRIGDVLVASVLLIATSPVLALALLLIKLEDGGPLLTKRVYVGLYGKHFRIWKLRTSRTEVERPGARRKAPNDQKVTRIGKVLRTLRLDTMPQLLSILTGDMSIVGPRPQRPERECLLEKKLSNYRLRQLVRPGLSGWANVMNSCGTNIEDASSELGYDLYYISNVSFWLDMLILMRSVLHTHEAKRKIVETKTNEHAKTNSHQISVLMPVFRPNLEWLKKTLESLNQQTFNDWLLVLSLDGEDESTIAAISVAKETLKSSQQMIVVRGKRAGISEALNRGLAACNTPYTARLDADDICRFDRLELQWQKLEEEPSLVACGMQIQAIDTEGREIKTRIHKYPTNRNTTLIVGALFNTPIAHPALMLRTRYALKVGGYRQKQCMEDYDLMARLCECGGLTNLGKVGLEYRVHDMQHSRQARPRRWQLLQARCRFLKVLAQRRPAVAVLVLVPFALFAMGPNREYELRRVMGINIARLIRKIGSRGAIRQNRDQANRA